MNWLDKLERKFGKFHIKGLMHYIVFINAVVYILSNYVDASGKLISKLVLEPSLVMRGEVWRLITYIFIPPSTSVLWIAFILYFYYMIGNALENEWGSFKFNVYYFTGMIGTTMAACVVEGGYTAQYLNLSLFLAFARIYPDYEMLLFFYIPIKIKYLALLDWIYIGFTVLFMPLPYKVVALVSIINYFVFFWNDTVLKVKTNRRVHHNRKNFREKIPKNLTIHRCAVCGITEKDNPKMEFRHCSKCEGNPEYCMEHLKNHVHIIDKKTNL